MSSSGTPQSKAFAPPGACPGRSGIQLVTATAAGLGASGTLSFVVAGDAATTVIITSAPANPVLNGTLTFTATVIPPNSTTPRPNGQVTWDLSGSPGSPTCGASTVVAGPGNTAVATCSISNAATGTYPVVADYNHNGLDPNYPEVSQSGTATVGRATPTVADRVDASKPGAGQPCDVHGYGHRRRILPAQWTDGLDHHAALGVRADVHNIHRDPGWGQHSHRKLHGLWPDRRDLHGAGQLRR